MSTINLCLATDVSELNITIESFNKQPILRISLEDEEGATKGIAWELDPTEIKETAQMLAYMSDFLNRLPTS